MQKTALAGLRNSYFGFATNCGLFRFLNLATVPLLAILFWTESVAQDLRPLNPGSTMITFIHVNDLHAHLTPHWDVVPDAPLGETSDRTKIVERGGLARLATIVKRIRADNPNSILMNIGDTYHGGVEAFYTNGNAIIEPVNALNIDVGVPGNWDFAYGPLVTRLRYTDLPITWFMRPMQFATSRITRRGPLQRLRDENDADTRGLDLMMPFGEIKRPNFPNLAANVTLTMPPMQRGRTLLPPTMIKTIGGVKVGFIGITSDIVPRMHPMLAFGMSFVEGESNYRALVNRYQKKLRSEGAGVVVVMSELGIQKDYRLAQIIEPGIDVIFSAHTHEAIFQPLTSASGAMVVEAGNDGYVGRMDVSVRGGNVVDRHWKLMPIDASISEDAAMKALVNKARAPFLASQVNFSVPLPMFKQKLTQPINTVVGYTKAPLDRRQVLESSFNNLMGDMLRRYSGADVAITPGFRFDSVIAGNGMQLEDNTVANGAITLEDVYRFFPVPYTLSTGEINGDGLHAVMETALSNVFSPDVFKQSGGWLEGFSGLETTLDLAGLDGHRITSLRLRDTRNDRSLFSTIKVVGCSRPMEPGDSLCSYRGFSNVRPWINQDTGLAWTPIDIFVNASLSGTFDSGFDSNFITLAPLWPRTPLVQPLEGLGPGRRY